MDRYAMWFELLYTLDLLQKSFYGMMKGLLSDLTTYEILPSP